jgi:hypothetical protein
VNSGIAATLLLLAGRGLLSGWLAVELAPASSATGGAGLGGSLHLRLGGEDLLVVGLLGGERSRVRGRVLAAGGAAGPGERSERTSRNQSEADRSMIIGSGRTAGRKPGSRPRQRGSHRRRPGACRTYRRVAADEQGQSEAISPASSAAKTDKNGGEV